MRVGETDEGYYQRERGDRGNIDNTVGVRHTIRDPKGGRGEGRARGGIREDVQFLETRGVEVRGVGCGIEGVLGLGVYWEEWKEDQKREKHQGRHLSLFVDQKNKDEERGEKGREERTA